MAYEKNVWVAHETLVSAEKLNHIEEGIEQLSEEIAAIGTQEDIVQQVIAALPVYNGEVV